MHGHFLRRISQNPEYVKSFCNILNIPFDFACPKWIFKDSSQFEIIFSLERFPRN